MSGLPNPSNYPGGTSDPQFRTDEEANWRQQQQAHQDEWDRQQREHAEFSRRQQEDYERRQPEYSNYTSSSSCFVATAAYQDNKHQDVQTLRTFRDQVLLTNFAGKVFVEFYYLVGPVLAKLLVLPSLRNLVKVKIGRLVAWIRVKYNIH